MGLGCLDHGVGISDVAIGDDPRQVVAGNGQHEGVGAGGQQQAVVGLHRAVLGDDLALDPVDFADLLVEVQLDAVVGVPVEVVEDDLGHRHLAGQDRGEQDAVVVGMGLGAEDGDVVVVRGDLQQLFQGAHAGHAVAHQHQFGFVHEALLRSPASGMRDGPQTASAPLRYAVVPSRSTIEQREKTRKAVLHVDPGGHTTMTPPSGGRWNLAEL